MGDPSVNLTEHFSYKDYKTWPEGERWELIRGQAFAMGSPKTAHQRVLGELFGQLSLWFQSRRCEVFLAPLDVLLAETQGQSEDEVDTVVQPDLFVVCDPQKIKETGVHGAPDWVVEILSPSTGWRDMTEKRSLYERHKVREYWVLNPDTLDLLIYRLNEGFFGAPVGASLKNTVEVGLFPGLRVSGLAT